MRAQNAIKVFITSGTTIYDFTDGILGIDIVRGVDEYEGVYQAPDVGQLILTTRNELADPNVTSAVRFNSLIQVYGTKIENGPLVLIYEGYVTDINVEYRPQNQPPLITINAVDQIGMIQRHKFTKDFQAYLNSTYGDDGVTLTELFTALNSAYYSATGKIEIPNFYATTSLMENHSPGTLVEGRAAVEAGDNAYEFIVQLMQSSLMQMHVKVDGSLYLYPHFKRDPDYFYYPSGYPEGTTVHFKSDGTGSSYKTINIDDGFDRTINQVFFQNTDKQYSSGNVVITTSDWGPYNSSTSINTWNSTAIELDTYINGASNLIEDTFNKVGNDIIQLDGNSALEAKTISWDALSNYTPSPTIDPFYQYNVHIYHKVTDLITIDKYYEVCGIRHSITESDWIITYVLKKNKFDIMRQYIPNYSPQISLSPASGNTNTDFTASISGIPAEQISKVRWQLASTYGNENYAPYVFDTPNISNPADGKTIVFDYDAGPNKPYFGAGVKKIRAWIETTTGFTLFANKTITVTAAQPVANFTYSIGEYGDVYFTDTSFDADSWSWNFGDGTTSTLQNPTKAYTTPGLKTVTLTISNGISTSTITKQFTINYINLIINWVRLQFKGIKTRTNGSSPWDKNLPIQISDIGVYSSGTNLIFQSGDLPDGPTNTTVKSTTGTVSAINDVSFNSPVITPWNPNNPPPNQYWSNLRWYYLITSYPYQLGANMVINPVITNGGNTEEIDIDVYIKMRPTAQNFQKSSISSINALFETKTSIPLVGTFTYYEQNKTYEKIKVYVSENTTTDFNVIKNDTSSWIECGYFQVSNITDTENSNEYFYRAMTPIIPMPPRKVAP